MAINMADYAGSKRMSAEACSPVCSIATYFGDDLELGQRKGFGMSTGRYSTGSSAGMGSPVASIARYL